MLQLPDKCESMPVTYIIVLEDTLSHDVTMSDPIEHTGKNKVVEEISEGLKYGGIYFIQIKARTFQSEVWHNSNKWQIGTSNYRSSIHVKRSI